MKVISFSAVEILPALLSKKKTQTIRLAKHDLEAEKLDYKQFMESICTSEGSGFREPIYKPPRFKVGEKVQIMWKCRSKYKWFCRQCGKGVTWIDMKKESPSCNCNNDKHTYKFSKILGTATITEVFMIEMWSGNDAPLVTGYTLRDTYKLAELDGFKAGDNGKYTDFYNFFCSQRYDWLDTPKKFWCYRWKWDNG